MSGALPVNAELLDWLAVELMDRGWSMKPLHRLIVTSQAYRMAIDDAASGSPGGIDQDNHLLRARIRGRMEAEPPRQRAMRGRTTSTTTLGGARPRTPRD